MATKDPAAVLFGDELQNHPLSASGERVDHWAEAGEVDIDIAMGGGFGFGEADDADFRIGKDGGRNQGVIDGEAAPRMRQEFDEARIEFAAVAGAPAFDSAETEAITQLVQRWDAGHAGADHAKIRIVNARDELRSTLRVAGFDKLFVLH